jgi:hypothetical protein
MDPDKLGASNYLKAGEKILEAPKATIVTRMVVHIFQMPAFGRGCASSESVEDGVALND